MDRGYFISFFFHKFLRLNFFSEATKMEQICPNDEYKTKIQKSTFE